MNIEKMREDFEAWAEDHHRKVGNWYERDGGMFELRLDGTYWVSWLESDFVAWQASRESLVIELPSDQCIDIHGYSPKATKLYCRKAIEAAGMKVKR